MVVKNGWKRTASFGFEDFSTEDSGLALEVNDFRLAGISGGSHCTSTHTAGQYDKKWQRP